MAKSRRAQHTDDQLALALSGDQPQHPAESHGLFSLSYLKRHLPQNRDFPTEEDVTGIHTKIASILQEHLAGLRKRREAATCSFFIEPILDELGWHRIPQEDMPLIKGMRKKPDYCLFASRDDCLAAERADSAILFSHSATVLEAKRWEHPLDQLSKTDTPGWFPSQQIQDYLNHAKDAQGNRFFNWAILTNGAEWRLYTDRSAVGAYFAFHVVRDDQLCSLDDVRMFVALFRSWAFQRNEHGLCFLDSIRDEALRLQGELEISLRKRIFGVLEDLGSAFVACNENGLCEDDYAMVYERSLIFLYRLLFVLYAESRGLLPVRECGFGANRRYRNDYSLARLTEQLRDQARYNDNAFSNLYESLLKLFALINGTNPRQNSALGVTRYNGGLFNPTLHPELESWRIGDRDLADILRQLIFSQPPARARQPQRQLSTDETIDYSTLEVRQLGDIYEGLLGAHFEAVNGRLELRNENGENHRHGIYYTPDWIVQFLIRETLTPLLGQIEQTDEVQRALQASSEEKKRDNSFAMGVLRINLVDPAMGSGHFLVRATEWLAEQILVHPTTRAMTQKVIANGPGAIGREAIVAQGKVPVAPGMSQEQAELAYWRRRVVEACIHGVDINPMAVELAKLSLWLTCIAVDEPLNFLDHHLRHGNALLGVAAKELESAPVLSVQGQHGQFDMEGTLQEALAAVIKETMEIEARPTTEMEAVKEKERRWKEARTHLHPLLTLANLWLAALDGVPIDELNYLSLAKLIVTPHKLSKEETAAAQRFLKTIEDSSAAKQTQLLPFHWQLEFPDVFFDEQGEPLPLEQRGFHAVLGNPPYVSVHTAMEPSNRNMRNALEKRAGYLEDLYVHFTQLGFGLLRNHGGFGFIVSDTFFTLASKQRMRDMLQANSLDWLGQCDPFDATVDAAIFVARKAAPGDGHRVRFVQARPLRRSDGSRTSPQDSLAKVPAADTINWCEPCSTTSFGDVRHTEVAELRLHDVQLELYRAAHKGVFFEPRQGTLQLLARFNNRVSELVESWWPKIEDSRAFAENIGEIRAYHSSLKPGDISLVGLVAEGGQGMRTANNARFLAYLEGTRQAEEIQRRALGWSRNWLADARIAPVYTRLMAEAEGDPRQPLADRAAWEAAVHGLRETFSATQLGFGRTDLFRIAPAELIATEQDYAFAFARRKEELLEHWRAQDMLRSFWGCSMHIEGKTVSHESMRSGEISDAEFCALCQHLQLWLAEENKRRRAAQRIPQSVLGLRSSEDYRDPIDAPRIATVYNGLYGRAQFVPFRKGDPEGNRWLDDEPLYISWNHENAVWMFTNSGRREPNMPVVRNASLYLTAGITWSAVANHVGLKCRFQDPCIFDADSMRLTPVQGTMSALAFAAIFNSDVFSFYKMRFVQHTQKWEIGSLREMPIVMPDELKEESLGKCSLLAMAAKRHEFAGSSPDNDLVGQVRSLAQQLKEKAPIYLRPSAQELLFATPRDCLNVIEKAVNWEAEKLYGVEGLGPFDEF